MGVKSGSGPFWLFGPAFYEVLFSWQAGDGFWSQLVKMDGESGSAQVWREEGTYPGEPIFVAKPGGTEEDGGVLLSVVLAGRCPLLQA